MRKILTFIIIASFACIALCGFTVNDNASGTGFFIRMLDESTDANERLVSYIDDLEAENAELREYNAALIAANEALENREPEVIYQTEYVEVPSEDEYIECGGCGAHVHDWYYIQNMSGTDVVAVCRDCYDASVAYYNGETVEQEIIEVD